LKWKPFYKTHLYTNSSLLDYLQFTFTVSPPVPGTDLLIAALADAGFESFEETEQGCKAWIAADSYDELVFDALAIQKDPEFRIGFTVERIASKNWNAEWESGFEPVIAGDCIIRAPFHPSTPDYKYEIIILPQMSFGTGHHETTALMVDKLLTLPMVGKKVLDMGCGTGVLAILATKLGASSVWAIDNNDNAFENTLENIGLNNAEGIHVHKGDATFLQGNLFHIIFANINRNVLLADMHLYAASLYPGGRILLSGFFETDIPQLKACCMENKLILQDVRIRNEWALLDFTAGHIV
jgi:ribosomal protein L11 methyltransferase